MRKTHRFAAPFALLALAALIGGTTGCSNEESDSEVITIAVAGPMSGSGAQNGVEIKNAALMKVQEINDAGGIDGKKIVLIIEDDKGNASEAANVARKLAGNKEVSIVVGHFNSSCSLAAKEEYNRKGVVEFSPGSTNIKVCENAPWTFRNLYRDDYQGVFLARYARNVLGLEKVAIFFDNDDYGAGLKNAFVGEAEKLGLKVIEPIAYERERTQDFKPLVEQIKGKEVGGIFISGLYNEAALIAKALRHDLHLDIPILAGDGVLSQMYIDLAGDAAEGSYVTTPFLFNTGNDSEMAKKFHDGYKDRYNEAPGTWSALSYDAVGMALEAIAAVGTDRDKIKEWFASRDSAENGYTGVTGITYFDSEGDCYSKGAYVAQVKDEKFVPAEKQMPADN